VIVAPPPSGNGDGVVRYSVARNAAFQPRCANAIIGSKVFEIVQASASCNVSVGVTTIDVPAGGGSGSLTIAANFEWRAIAGVPWIQLTSPTTGTTSATLTFSAQAKPGTAARTGNIAVNGQTVAVIQTSQTCTLSIAPATLILPAREGTGVAEVHRQHCGAPVRALPGPNSYPSSVNGSGQVRATMQQIRQAASGSRKSSSAARP
jgi:hypothetical protein